MTMELSMTIALLSALAIGEFFTALVITAFVLAAEILEGLTVGRGRRAIQDMLDFLPQRASVLRDNQIVEVDTKTIVPGEVVVIRPGSRIPVDGRVLSGHSFVEQAAITGEPIPSEKSTGSDVYAGTINQAGTLQIRAERLGKETTFGKIIEAVENAERSRAPIQKTADRLAGYLVYFALGAALLTFLITHNLRSTISVIIVAGACGIAAGTPLAILGAIGRAARNGSIIKGGIYLEALGRLQTVFLDKTGTLTYGFPQVSQVRATPGISERALLEAAACAETSSEHPRRIVRYKWSSRACQPSILKPSPTALVEGSSCLCGESRSRSGTVPVRRPRDLATGQKHDGRRVRGARRAESGTTMARPKWAPVKPQKNPRNSP